MPEINEVQCDTCPDCRRYFSRWDLLEEANQRFGRGVDADMLGKQISDFDVLLAGAYGPAVERIVNRAVATHGAVAPLQITHDVLLPLARQAVAEKVDFNLIGQPMPPTDYEMILTIRQHGYADHVVNLVNIALERFAQNA